MQQRAAQENFLISDFSGVDAHDYEPFRQGCIDVKLPIPNSDIRLFIFNPTDYPYLWAKYLEGLQREYGRIGVDHILDLEILNNPASSAMGILAIIDGKIVSGMRFQGPVRKADEASVYKEMAGGDQTRLKQLLEEWIPEKVVEGKGLWLDTRHPARKRILQSMARSSLYGAALLGARYVPGSCPANIMKIHAEIGLQEMKEIGCVAYPNENFKTTFGLYDLQKVLDLCTDQNRILLRRDWQQIQHVRLQNVQHRNNENTWLPIILDEANPFHASALESLSVSSEYEKRTTFKSMQVELSELIPPLKEDLQNESKRWVAYPWRKIALELVGPRSFKRLLRDRNRNKITDLEQEQLASLSIGVVGLSTGHVIAHTMVMEGVCGHIKLADFDTLEVSNLNRIPASLVDLSTNKAVITARRIAELDPYLSVEVFEDGLLASNIDSFMSGLDIIIEECDSLDVKVLVREEAIKRKIPVLMSTSDLGMMDIERYDLDANPKPFHGLANVKASELKDLSRKDKSGYALAIVEGEKISARLAASMVEIGHTVSTWAQLASDVTQGAALVTTAVRLIGTNKSTPSSRTRMDMEQVLSHGTPPTLKSITVDNEAIMPCFTGDPVEDMHLAASFAPSAGNMQPWKISWINSKLHLEIDRKRSSSQDINSRASMIALGAATLNAEIVADYHQLPYKVEYLPLKSKPDLVSRFSLAKKTDIGLDLGQFYPYLLTRKTNREISERQPLPIKTMSKLGQIAKQHPVKLHTLSKLDQLEQYAEILMGADRVRHLSTHLHEEMMSDLAWPGKDRLDLGIDVRTLGLEYKDLSVLPIIERKDVMDSLSDWDGGKALGDCNKERVLCSSAIVALTIEGLSNQDYVEGGRALQKFWLTTEQLGIAVQPMSPVFLYANDADEMETLVKGEYIDEITALQLRFNKLLNIKEGEYPLIVLRLSFAKEPDFRSLRAL